MFLKRFNPAEKGTGYILYGSEGKGLLEKKRMSFTCRETSEGLVSMADVVVSYD